MDMFPEIKEHKFELKEKFQFYPTYYYIPEESPLYTLYSECNEKKKDLLTLALEEKLITKEELRILKISITGKCTDKEKEVLCKLHKKLNIPRLMKWQFTIFNGMLKYYIADNSDILLLKYFINDDLKEDKKRKVVYPDDILWMIRGIVERAKNEKFIISLLDICKKIMDRCNCRKYHQQYNLIKICIPKKNARIFKRVMEISDRAGLFSIDTRGEYAFMETSIIKDVFETECIPMIEYALEISMKKKVKLTLV